MKVNNQYGNGRLSVIKELRVFCEKRIAAIKDTDNVNNAGQICKGCIIKGYAAILQELEVKENNIIRKLLEVE